MNTFFRKLAWFAQRRRKEEQLAAELQFHLEEEAEELQTAGLAQDEARRAARREFCWPFGECGRCEGCWPAGAMASPCPLT
jgi:hypothetical protein